MTGIAQLFLKSNSFDIRPLSFHEIDMVAGGVNTNREDACEVIGNFSGGALGIVAAAATTAIGGPALGATAGLFFATVGTMAATRACNNTGTSSGGNGPPLTRSNPIRKQKS